MSLSFEELRVTVKEQLDLLNETDLQAVTFKSIKEELLSKFSPDEIGKWKGEIKDFLGEYVNTRLNSAHSEGNDNSDVDEESEDEKSSQSSSSDSDDPTVAALPAEWREAFGEVCWVKGQKSFPWWPAYIYNPSRLNAKLRSKAIPVAGKKHTVLYFGSKDFGFVSPSQIKRPFEEFKEEFSKQTISKKYLAMFQQAIPDAEAELAKPKEDRMFIERPQHKRKLVPNSRKKSTKPTLKEVKTVEEEVEEKDEEEEEEDEEEEEEEDEVVSGDESEAEFDDSPRKKPKTLRKTNEQSHKQTDKSSSHKKPRKSSPTDVSKREKTASASGKEKDKPPKDKVVDSSKKKPKSESSKSRPDSQKKRKAEEEALAEAEREKIKKLQKSSDVPVWKQVRQENVAEVFPTKDKKNENLKEDSRIASAKAEETREQRAKRLTGLIDLHLKKSPPNIESALKCMGKAKDMNLTIDELRRSGFADALNLLRKHSDPHIANEAKSIRNYLKQALQQGAVIEPPVEKSPSVDVPTIPPAPLVEELPEVIKRDETVPNNPENPSPQTMEEYEPLDCSGPHFQTSVALLRDPNSAFHDAPEKIINRIVATVASRFPDSGIDNMEHYIANIHKFAYQLKDQKHSSLLQALLAHPIAANIEYLLCTSPEDWLQLPAAK